MCASYIYIHLWCMLMIFASSSFFSSLIFSIRLLLSLESSFRSYSHKKASQTYVAKRLSWLWGARILDSKADSLDCAISWMSFTRIALLWILTRMAERWSFWPAMTLLSISRYHGCVPCVEELGHVQKCGSSWSASEAERGRGWRHEISYNMVAASDGFMMRSKPGGECKGCDTTLVQ